MEVLYRMHDLHRLLFSLCLVPALFFFFVNEKSSRDGLHNSVNVINAPKLSP